MLQLIEPERRYLASYTEAYDEMEANCAASSYGLANARTQDIFLAFHNSRHCIGLRPGWVGADHYWLVDDERDYFIGEINIRHQLTEALLRYGGHIGYCVRFSEWNKGYCTFMLQQAFGKAKARGITRVLLTCNDENLASARVMEKNGMVMADKIPNFIDGKWITTRRYWKDLT